MNIFAITICAIPLMFLGINGAAILANATTAAFGVYSGGIVMGVGFLVVLVVANWLMIKLLDRMECND